MKKIIFLALITTTINLNAFSQDFLGNGTYAYGKVENSLSNKVLVIFKSIEPMDQSSILDNIEKYGVVTVSYFDYFLPGVSYEENEINSFLDSMNISSIFVIKFEGANSSNNYLSNSFYSSLTNTIFTIGKSYKTVDNVNLNFEIFNRSNNLKRPVAVLLTEGINIYGASGSTSGTTYRTIKKVIKTLDKEGAFTDSEKSQYGDGIGDFLKR